MESIKSTGWFLVFFFGWGLAFFFALNVFFSAILVFWDDRILPVSVYILFVFVSGPIAFGSLKLAFFAERKFNF